MYYGITDEVTTLGAGGGEEGCHRLGVEDCVGVH